MSKHTATPWELVTLNNGCGYAIDGPAGEVVIPLSGNGDDLAHIVRCVNSHDALLFQLLSAANYIDALGGDSKSYRQAIAAAKGDA